MHTLAEGKRDGSGREDKCVSTSAARLASGTQDSQAWPLFEGTAAMVVFLGVPKTVYRGNDPASFGEAPVHMESLSNLTGLKSVMHSIRQHSAR